MKWVGADLQLLVPFGRLRSPSTSLCPLWCCFRKRSKQRICHMGVVGLWLWCNLWWSLLNGLWWFGSLR